VLQLWLVPKQSHTSLRHPGPLILPSIPGPDQYQGLEFKTLRAPHRLVLPCAGRVI